MDPNTVASIVAAIAAIAAAVASLIAVPFTARAANAARKQTELQRAIAEAAAQPYVWADIRVNEATGWRLDFVLGNSGPTTAHNVTVTIDPSLPLGEGQGAALTGRAFERLRDGIKTLGPGRTLEWGLGPSPDLMGDDRAQPFSIRIDAHGPHGPLATLEYVIDLADYRESNAAPTGSLHQLTRAVKDIEKKL